LLATPDEPGDAVAGCGLLRGFTNPKKHKAPPEGEAKCLKHLVGRVGIEPTTNELRV
jgi:hypothetical protein